MALPLREAFTARALGVLWNDYKAKLGTGPYSGRMKFGTVKQDSLDLKFIKGKNGLPVSLKASNFDAQAPLRDVGGFSDIQNEMPFYRESYMVTEKEEQEYANYQSAENSNMANQVLQEIAKKPFSLIQGALVVPERQIWELLAPEDGVPKVTVNIEGKKYVVEYTTDSGAAHKKDHFVEISGDEDKWNASATATPLDDLIQARRDFAKKTGYSLTRFSMNTETFEMILKAEDTKKQVLGITAYNGGIRVRQADVLSYLREYGIEIEVYDKVYIDEEGNTKYFIPTNIVSAQSAGVYLGDYTWLLLGDTEFLDLMMKFGMTISTQKNTLTRYLKILQNMRGFARTILILKIIRRLLQ